MSKFKHQKKHYPKTTVNVDTSITGSGGVAVSLGPVDPDKSEAAWQRACREATSHEDRVVLAYQYLSEKNAVRADDFLTPDATIPYTTKGQPANIERARSRPAPALAPAKKKRKAKPQNSELQELRREIAQLKKANSQTRRLESVSQDFDRELAAIQREEEAMERAQARMERDAIQSTLITKPSPVKERTYTEQDAVEAIKKGFASLGIPNLGPIPNKPTFRVQFDLGSIGKQEAWYHWVSEHEGGLFLIYDTRFEYGIRYSPPKTGLDGTIRVILPDHGKSYVVHSIDLVHPFGVFSITNLLHASKQPEPQDNGIFGYGPPQIQEVADFLPGEEDNDGEEWRDPRGYYSTGEERSLQKQLRV